MDLIAILLFILPAYFANAAPVVLGGGAPVDFGRKFFDGKRLFGDGKTIQGFAGGVACGFFVGVAEAYIIPGTQYAFYPTPIYYAAGGFLLALGTMIGDLLGSFVKRRLDMPQGSSSVLLDELSFLLVALLFSLLVSPSVLTWEAVLVLVVLTYFVHKAANIAANRLGLKKVPW